MRWFSLTAFFLIVQGLNAFVIILPDNNYTNCNSTLHTPGHIQAPNYPGTYPTSTMCLYKLIAPVGQKVRIVFTYVDTEPCCDNIDIFDGGDTSATRIRRISGRLGNQGQTVTSSGNLMTVRFYSDLTVTYHGFTADFSSV